MPLNAIQAELEQIYDLPTELRVENFLITDSARARELADGALGPEPAAEALLLRQSGDSLDIGLFIAPEVLERLQRSEGNAHWSDRSLEDFWLALEGVSHFLAVVWRAERGRCTTALELETQAEIDKFILTAARLVADHGRVPLRPLQSILFRRARIRTGLSRRLQNRYRGANALAESFCANLEQRHRLPRRQESLPMSLLQELRRFYRLDWPAKLAHIGRAN